MKCDIITWHSIEEEEPSSVISKTKEKFIPALVTTTKGMIFGCCYCVFQDKFYAGFGEIFDIEFYSFPHKPDECTQLERVKGLIRQASTRFYWSEHIIDESIIGHDESNYLNNAFDCIREACEILHVYP